jgi:hypothetical protein
MQVGWKYFIYNLEKNQYNIKNYFLDWKTDKKNIITAVLMPNTSPC